MSFHPNEDGVTHINIYSRSQCRLGMFLSHFPKTPFTHPDFGTFQSMEGFWYYLKTGCQHEYLKGLYGYEAKAFGKKLEIVPRDDFLEQIKQANLIKLETYPFQKKLLRESVLPLTHYYVFGNWRMENGVRVWDENVQVRQAKGSEWLLEFWQTTRERLKQT